MGTVICFREYVSGSLWVIFINNYVLNNFILNVCYYNCLDYVKLFTYVSTLVLCLYSMFER